MLACTFDECREGQIPKCPKDNFRLLRCRLDILSALRGPDRQHEPMLLIIIFHLGKGKEITGR